MRQKVQIEEENLNKHRFEIIPRRNTYTGIVTEAVKSYFLLQNVANNCFQSKAIAHYSYEAQTNHTVAYIPI